MSPEPGTPAPSRQRHPLAPTILVLLMALGAIVAPGAARGGADAGAGHAGSERPLVRLTRADAWFGFATALGVGAAAFADHELRRRALATDGDGARNLARAVQPFGAPEVVGPALLAAYVAGRALERPALWRGATRVGVPVAVAAVATGVIKVAVGRVRPADAAAESDAYQPLSGHASFPSGHAALAFATATALDRETRARWVPWVAYPLATLVGWSRVRDDRHWTSDVVAGAALGAWTAAKAHEALPAPEQRSGRVGVHFDGRGGALHVGVRVSLGEPRDLEVVDGG